MSFAFTTTLENIESFLRAQGWFSDVEIGELSAPPSGDGFAASIRMASAGMGYLTQHTTVQTHAVTVRLYRSATQEPNRDVELALADLVSTVITAAIGHFDLTTSVANLEVEAIDVEWDDEEVANVLCRTAAITLPLQYREAA